MLTVHGDGNISSSSCRVVSLRLLAEPVARPGLLFESCSLWCANVCQMDDERLVLGPADARWNDYVGTAAADDAPVVAGLASLYSIAGVDRDRWTIVGMDLSRWE
jgi:hypothetical protein